MVAGLRGLTALGHAAGPAARPLNGQKQLPAALRSSRDVQRTWSGGNLEAERGWDQHFNICNSCNASPLADICELREHASLGGGNGKVKDMQRGKPWQFEK